MIRNVKAITASCYLSMFFLGVSALLIGAAARNIGLSPYQIGLLITAQQVGSFSQYGCLHFPGSQIIKYSHFKLIIQLPGCHSMTGNFSALPADHNRETHVSHGQGIRLPAPAGHGIFPIQRNLRIIVQIFGQHFDKLCLDLV